MSLPILVLGHPLGTTFYDWSAILGEQMAQYNVPNPVEEGLWQTWATAFCSIPDVQERGLPDPQLFTDWRGWAMASIPLLE